MEWAAKIKLDDVIEKIEQNEIFQSKTYQKTFSKTFKPIQLHESVYTTNKQSKEYTRS